jgi:hypothetical protein
MYHTTVSVGQAKPWTVTKRSRAQVHGNWRFRMHCFKIMDFKEGKLKTLFHGTDGTRVVPQWELVKAQVREHATDGGPGSAMYRSGWHVLETLEQAKAYLKKFKNMTHKVIVKCEISGDIWKKDHSPAEGLWLGEWIFVTGIVWVNVKSLFDGSYREEK